MALLGTATLVKAETFKKTPGKVWRYYDVDPPLDVVRGRASQLVATEGFFRVGMKILIFAPGFYGIAEGQWLAGGESDKDAFMKLGYVISPLSGAATLNSDFDPALVAPARAGTRPTLKVEPPNRFSMIEIDGEKADETDATDVIGSITYSIREADGSITRLPERRLDELNEYDWKEAFGYAGELDTQAGRLDAVETVGSPCPTEPFGRTDVAQIIAMDEGEPDGRDWIIVGRLLDGRFFFLSAGCDYTGWD